MRLGLWVLAAAVAAGCKKEEDSASGGQPEAVVQIASGAQPDDRGGGSGTQAIDPDAVAVAAAKAKLAFEHFRGDNTDDTRIESKLNLISELDGVQISWTLDALNVILEDGSVVRPSFGAPALNVQLTARLKKGARSDGKTFTVTLAPSSPTDQQAVDAAKADLTEDDFLAANFSLGKLMSALSLPSSGLYGVTLTWSTTVAQLNVSSGAVARPASNAANVSGTLTATLAKGSATTTKSFNVRVVRELPPLVITEVYPGNDAPEETGFIELQNTTSTPIDLDDYLLVICQLNDDCTGAPAGGALPTFNVPAGGHVILAYGNTASAYGLYGSTAIVVHSTLVRLRHRNGMVELRNAANSATIDFVRYRDPTYTSGTAVERNPAFGTFSSTVSLTATAAGTSIGRPHPYVDSDTGADWIVYELSSPGYVNAPTATATDSDGDGLTDAYEQTVSLTDPTKRDTDGDWFTDGQEVLDAGVFGINLKALGASPLVRDVFVEVDYMANPAGLANSLTDSTGNATSLPLRKAALDKVVAAFDAYTPDANDGRAKKIKVHFDVGGLYSGNATIDPAQHNLGGGNQIPFTRCLYLGWNYADADGVTRTSSNCANLYDIKLSHFDPARRYVFHYMMVGWSQDVDGANGSSGVAEQPGNDLILSVGSYGALSEQTIVNFQAATIMHELGHNLNLGHGGHEEQNYKPNYMSSMNYLYQLEGLDLADDGKLFYTHVAHPTRKLSGAQISARRNSAGFAIGFSSGNRLTLAEASLDETLGWAGAGFPIDFDEDDVHEALVANVNLDGNASSADVHEDHDDWKNLKVKFQETAGVERNGAVFQLTGEPVDPDRQPLSRPCAPPRIALP